MKAFGWIIAFAIFTSPLLFILSGCQWTPDAPGNVIHVKTSDFLTPRVKPVVAPVAEPTKFAPVTYDPNRVPAEDDPYAPPAKVTLPKSNPPLTNAEELCADGSCAVQGGGGGRRGLFGRWRR